MKSWLLRHVFTMSVAQQDGYAIGNPRDGEAADIEGSWVKGAESGVAPGAGRASVAWPAPGASKR